MLKGACLCRAITYEIDEEVTELVFCHCSFCRKATSSAFSVNARVSRESVRLQGQEQLTTYQSTPGKHRYYCRNCHSQLFHIQEETSDILTLKMGTVEHSDQDLNQVTKRHIFQDSNFVWLQDK